MDLRLALLASILLAVSTVQSEGTNRGRSKFRSRIKPNPFDLTQPVQAASAAVQTSAIPASNTLPRRRVAVPGGARTAGAGEGGRVIKRRIGSPASGRTRSRSRANANGAAGAQNRVRVRGRTKPNRNRKTGFKKAAAGSGIRNNASPGAVSAKSDGYKVVCYYTNWSQYRNTVGKFLPEHIDPHICTHVIYAFGWLKKGKLSSFEENDESKDGKVGFYEQITGLKKINPKLKVLLALGGWTFGTKRFRNMAKSRYTRQNFIFSAIPFLRHHNFDGLDLDWEYPSGKGDKNNLNLLCKELMEAFSAESGESREPRLLLTAAVAVGPDKIKGGYDIPTLAKYLDFINVMAYDFHGKWEKTVGHNAPVYAPSTDSKWRKQLSVSHASELWNRLGAPKEKLIIGMPTYGRSFTLANPAHYIVNTPASAGGVAGIYTGEEGFLAYYEVCEMLQSGGRYYWDEEMQVPYVVKGDQWVGFDDERAIRNKMKYIKNSGFGGAMVWSIDMDDFSGQVCGGNVKYPLVSIMAEELLGKKRVGKDVDWSKVTSVSVAEFTTLPPPVTIDPIAGVNAFLATSSTGLVITSTTQRDQPKVLCYFTSWSNKRPGAGRFEPDGIDPFLCTHVIYAFATLVNHRLAPGQASDIGDGIRPGTFEKLVALKEKNPSLKIMVALGGWAFGSKPFQDLVSNPFRMNGFVYDSVEFLRQHGLDGLDVDWEYPKGIDDKANYVNLVKELRVAFEGEASSTGHPRLLLSAAVPASFEAMHAGYDVPEISKYLDFLNVMTYDFHGQWEDTVGHNSPLFPLVSASSYAKKQTVDYSIKAWIREGAPSQKIMVGMPTYGRSFALANNSLFDIGSPAVGGGAQGRYTQETGFLSYYEVCEFLFEDNTTLVWDNEQHVPFAYNGDQFVGFDDERSYATKIEWLKENHLGGTMIWSVDMDDFRGNCGTGKYPLLNTVIDNLGNYTVPQVYVGPYENTGTLDGQFTKKDPNVVHCEEADGHISFHKDNKECTKYYMCEGERKHHMSCPVNLVFNADQTVCDWPENVEGCGAPPPAGKRR